MRVSLIALATALIALPAAAQQPDLADPNECPSPGGQGDKCKVEAECALKPYATICVEHLPGDPQSRKCAIPCEKQVEATLEKDRKACAIGETCLEQKATPGRKAYACKPTNFRVDLNLLDQCVVHHLEGLEPAFSENKCSLEANLTALMDQNGDQVFNIFDLDLCVVAFLEQPTCDLETGECQSNDLVPCAADADCGDGLYCDSARNTCQRDCGIIASREEEIDELDRQCTGAMKSCDYARGRCEPVDVTKATCEADSQCPAGAYCLLGRCAPKCYRSVDCPGTDWYCTANNRCRALAHPSADDTFEFDPKNYAIRFARDSLKLDAIQVFESSPLLIMDLLTKKQVLDDPSVTFGYRLEITYGLKMDAKCLRPFIDCSNTALLADGETEVQCNARQNDCMIDDTEQWIRAISPFGTISAAGGGTIQIELEPAIADKLSPGSYSAKVRVIFDNGDSDSVPVKFVKASPSGEYTSVLSVHMGAENNRLNGQRSLTFGMRLKVADEIWQWNKLMDHHNLSEKGDTDDITDITKGQLVTGLLHGNSALAFTKGDQLEPQGDEVRFVGLYSPDLGRIRLAGVIEIKKDFCIGEDGDCPTAEPDDLKVRNLFARDIRRRIEFIGPFDQSLARFHGIYREKISGLAADYDITLEGGFVMTQSVADDSPLVFAKPLLEKGSKPPAYPKDKTVLETIDAEIALVCDASSDPKDGATAAFAQKQFASSQSFTTYLKQAKRAGPANDTSILGKTTIFPTLLQFSEIIEQALTALGTDKVGQQDHLNIYDFVSSRLLPCDVNDPSPPPACIDEKAVRCGLLLHQRAILSGWITLDELKGGADNPLDGEQDLFCVDTIPTEGCPATAGDAKALFTLQEHNRFWQDLGQILKFSADRARSDAFLVLFRNEVNPFAQGAALSYKADRLREAVGRYDQLVDLIAGPAAGKVLHMWPAKAFKQMGYDWLKIMQTIVEDRMSAVSELVDLKRRIFMGAGDSDFLYANHMMQQEFLLQVYLMSLQEKWQKELFSYKGEAAALLEEGQVVLQQLNPKRNPLGNQPGVVFFENSNPDTTNWVNYRDVLVGEDGEGGLMEDAKSQVGWAVDNLQGALEDLDELEGSLLESQLTMEDSLAEMCGDPDPSNPNSTTDSYCQYLIKKYNNYKEWESVRNCKFPAAKDEKGKVNEPADIDCTEVTPENYLQCADQAAALTTCPENYSFECVDYSNKLDDGKNSCAQVVASLSEASNDINIGVDPINDQARCLLDGESMWVEINGQKRPCVGGRMGALLQQKALHDLDRRIVIGSIETFAREMNGIINFSKEWASLEKKFNITAGVVNGVQLLMNVVSGIFVSANGGVAEFAGAADCMILVGFSNGSDCPQKLLDPLIAGFAVFMGGLFETAFGAINEGLDILLDQLEKDKEITQFELEIATELISKEREIDPLIDEYNHLSQESFNVGAEIEDLRWQAQHVVDRYNKEVTFVAEHLVGRESGYVLLGDHLVQEAGTTFREILQYANRMTLAFAHHYNLPPGEAAQLVAESLALVTLDDVDQFVEKLDKMAMQYCGLQAIDCDYNNNGRVLRFSVRDQLFPQLRDIVDGKTGKVVTAGQQFHNTITQPPYLKRRIRGVNPTDQIELPISVTVQLQEATAGGPEWLIDPLECNQVLDPHDPGSQEGTKIPTGNVAINVVGQNLGTGSSQFSYTLARGGMDFIRSCEAESVVEEIGTLPVLSYPIRKHLIGYAPQSAQAQKDTVPAFVVRSSSFSACINNEELNGDLLDGTCWRFFARDRSLASPDWKVIVPLFISGGATDTAWITGEGLTEDERPIIEDIVIYFRYRSRPINEL